MRKYEFEIFADYFMIFVQDDSLKNQRSNIHWSDDDLNTMLYVIKSGFIIAAARNMDVLLFVNIFDSKPVIKENEWDQIVECGINLPSGILSISGASDYIGDHGKIELNKGIYNALICYTDLGTISEDGLDGNDSYYLNIWPDETLLPKKVIKQWKSSQ